MAKILILLGCGLIAAGVLWHFGLLKWVGKLPGDIRIEKEGFSLYFPFMTCLVISATVSLVVKLFQHFSK